MNIPYSRESGSLFPDSVLDMKPLKDIDDSVKDVMKEYYRFMEEGNIDSALALKDAHPELQDYWVSAAKLNRITEEIQNIEIYAKLLRTNVISDTEPELNYDTGCFWIQEIYEEALC